LLDAEVIAVHARSSEDEFPSDAEFGAWCGPLRHADLSVRRVIEDDDPARLLRRVAGDEDADLVVVGATHCGEVAGLFLGSVVEEMAYHGRRPVVIVPIPGEDDQK
jgi:nucleotide-binding universal stress UspA family protein